MAYNGADRAVLGQLKGGFRSVCAGAFQLTPFSGYALRQPTVLINAFAYKIIISFCFLLSRVNFKLAPILLNYSPCTAFAGCRGWFYRLHAMGLCGLRASAQGQSAFCR